MSGSSWSLRSQVAHLRRVLPCSPELLESADCLNEYRDYFLRKHFPGADMEKPRGSRFERVSAAVDVGGLNISVHARTPSRTSFVEKESRTLVLCFSGLARHMIDGRVYELAAGSEALVGFGAAGEAEVGLGASGMVSFDPAILNEAIRSINASPEQSFPSGETLIGSNVLVRRGHQQSIASTLRLAFMAANRHGFMSEAAAADLVLRAIAMMMIDALELPEIEVSRMDGSRAASRARAFMLDRIGEDITLTQLEQAAGVSRRSLQMHFRHLFGMAPMQYLREQRLLAAHEMLSSGRYERVTDVALACGFVHMSGFSTLFRERFGLPPGEFARRSRS